MNIDLITFKLEKLKSRDRFPTIITVISYLDRFPTIITAENPYPDHALAKGPPNIKSE